MNEAAQKPRGKRKCRVMKDIRQRIADVNGIPYFPARCTYEGECPGTCPQCDGELRHLDGQMKRRAEAGQKTRIDMLCLDQIEEIGRECFQQKAVWGRETEEPERREEERQTGKAGTARQEPPANEPEVFPLIAQTRLRINIDGAGITTMVSAAGCPLQCRWCLNQKIMREREPEPVTPQGLLEKVMIDDLYFRSTGGGITFSGGEPLLYASFIDEFRRICPKEWKIRAETSLAVTPEKVLTAAGAADLFIVDCKNMDPAIYSAYAGGLEALMEENLKLLIGAAGPERIIVRVPLIPGYNNEEARQRSADRLRSMGIRNLDLFSYIMPNEEENRQQTVLRNRENPR